MAQRVLVVDDDAQIVEVLSYNLRQAGYVAVTAGDVVSAMAEVHRHRPDLVLLDLGLPDAPGTEICRRLRRDPETRTVPIIMVTARCDEIDRVIGFELGADDYVIKPFSPRELMLRIAAVLRRGSTPSHAPGERFRIGTLEVDVPRHRVTVDDHDVVLTALEFRLLHDLMSKPGRVQTRDSLLERVWGQSPELETRTIDTHVKRLREKLGTASEYIETVRGIGYRVRAD